MLLKNHILLLKAQNDAPSDKYTALLCANHFDVKQVKTLDFVFENLDKLQEKLANPQNYSGILLSSPRCVQAVHQALQYNPLMDNWKSKNNYAVGEATYQLALDDLHINCKGKESGNAVNLSRIIIENKSAYATSKTPFLFPHGNLKTGTLNEELSKENLSMDQIQVYQTINNPNIEQELNTATNCWTEVPEFVVFFSPSGYRSTIELIRHSPHFDEMKFVAIGPVTELAIIEDNIKVYNVAKNPTPEDVLEAIKSH